VHNRVTLQYVLYLSHKEVDVCSVHVCVFVMVYCMHGSMVFSFEGVSCPCLPLAPVTMLRQRSPRLLVATPTNLSFLF